MIFSREYFERMKDYFHPNVQSSIENYWDAGNELYMLPTFHDCGLKNKNGTKK